MIGFLRLAGLLNAAVWFGSAVFFTFVAAPAAFSQDMRGLLGEKNYPYFSGMIAQIVIARFFRVQLVCGILALLVIGAEDLYLGKTHQRLRFGLVITLIMGILIGSFWLQPKLKRLHAIKYGQNVPAAEAAAAARAFRAWHGFSQVVNLVVLAGLAVHLWRVANPSDPVRFVGTTKFRS